MTEPFNNTLSLKQFIALSVFKLDQNLLNSTNKNIRGCIFELSVTDDANWLLDDIQNRWDNYIAGDAVRNIRIVRDATEFDAFSNNIQIAIQNNKAQIYPAEFWAQELLDVFDENAFAKSEPSKGSLKRKMYDFIRDGKTSITYQDVSLVGFYDLFFSRVIDNDVVADDETKRVDFIDYCKTHGVANTAEFYESSLRRLEKKLHINIDDEYGKDKCNQLLNEIPGIFGSDAKDYSSKVRKFVEYKDSLSASVSAEEKKKETLRRYEEILTSSYNVIFRGAPGTGKSYLAKSIAAYMVSENDADGPKTDYKSLSDDEKKRIGFVQFHPSYDYSDFVEGLRPVKTASKEIVFDRKDGIFKEFVERAKQNYINSKKDVATVEKELNLKELVETFLEEAVDNATKFTTARGNQFTIPAYNDISIDINIPSNPTIKDLTISMNELCKMLESTDTFNTPKDVKTFFKKKNNTQGHSYLCVLWKEITAFKKSSKFVSTTTITEKEPLKNYVFIIDEINRGEISKILGELFFSIDPGYRGEDGGVFTQYSNMHDDENEKFYIPKNVYIIGTMNDIDRSVDTFDFAMRRRFRFIEIKANEHTNMLKNLKDDELMEEAIRRMQALNEAISKTDGLNENYHVGAAYFLKLKDLDGTNEDKFGTLWTDYLEPLLQEYVNGMATYEKEMKKFKDAYTLTNAKAADNDAADEDEDLDEMDED